MKSKYSLENNVIVITGGAGLIGREFAKAVASNGGIAILADIDEKLGKKTANRISKEIDTENIEFIKLDITSKNSIDKMIEFLVKKYRKIDALVNNAYPTNKNYGRKFEDVEYKDFCENVNMHLGGYFLVTKEVSRVMKRQNYGNIINIASIYGFVAPRFEIYKGTDMTVPVEYSAIKGGLINLTKYLASYLGKYNIRVNAISPGGVYDNQPENFVKKYSERVVLGKKMGNRNDLKGALLFLLSDASKYITGQNIVVDGGWSL